MDKVKTALRCGSGVDSFSVTTAGKVVVCPPTPPSLPTPRGVAPPQYPKTLRVELHPTPNPSVQRWPNVDFCGFVCPHKKVPGFAQIWRCLPNLVVPARLTDLGPPPVGYDGMGLWD